MSKVGQLTELTKNNLEFYSDMFTDFSRHAVTGELNRKTNENAVKQSVKNLLLTNKYERLFNPEIGSNLERDNRMWLDSNSFVESAIDEFQEIWKKLNNRCVLHGDLWNENIIVNEEGRLAGLIDWEHSCVYDPHWEFRMIRRFIGWDGLEMLLYYYNRKSIFTLEFNIIKTLDKFWMCHQYIHRLKKSDSNAALFLEYIEKWPNCLYEISNNYIQRE